MCHRPHAKNIRVQEWPKMNGCKRGLNVTRALLGFEWIILKREGCRLQYGNEASVGTGIGRGARGD